MILLLIDSSAKRKVSPHRDEVIGELARNRLLKGSVPSIKAAECL